MDKYWPRRDEVLLRFAVADGTEKIQKVKTLSETRWVERHTATEDLEHMYEGVIACLGLTASSLSGWDTKSVTDANGLFTTLTCGKFLIGLYSYLCFSGYLKTLSTLLQGRSQDIISAHASVSLVVSELVDVRSEPEKNCLMSVRDECGHISVTAMWKTNYDSVCKGNIWWRCVTRDFLSRYFEFAGYHCWRHWNVIAAVLECKCKWFQWWLFAGVFHRPCCRWGFSNVRFQNWTVMSAKFVILFRPSLWRCRHWYSNRCDIFRFRKSIRQGPAFHQWQIQRTGLDKTQRYPNMDRLYPVNSGTVTFMLWHSTLETMFTLRMW